MTWLLASASFGWIAALLVAAAAIAGTILRRRGIGRIWTRTRPHHLLGYAALAMALAHVWFSMGAMHDADANGIRIATLALAALGTQTFIGASLRDPGDYRRELQRAHIALLAGIAILLAWHIAANSAVLERF